MPAKRETSGRLVAEAGASARTGLAKSLDIVTPYNEAGDRLAKYFTYGLPDNNKATKPSPLYPAGNKERLTEWVSGLRPNLFKWSPQYEKWVKDCGPLALAIEPVTGEYKEQTVREQEVKLAETDLELPPEILSQLLVKLTQEEIEEAKTLQEVLPRMPKPADEDLLGVKREEGRKGRNSFPSLDPYIVALGTDLKHRLPYLYVVGIADKKEVVKTPLMEYSFRSLGAGPVDPGDIALAFNNVVPGKDFIYGLLNPRTEGAGDFKKLLEDFELEPKMLIEAMEKLRDDYCKGWKLD